MNLQPISRIARAAIVAAVMLEMPAVNAQDDRVDQHSYNLGVVGAFAEMVNVGAKRLALSSPLTTEQMNAFIVDARKVAARNGTLVYRETDLLVTDLFPEDVAEHREVLLIYQGTTLSDYLQIKSDKQKLVEAGVYTGVARRDIARRFGRMLSYPPQKINDLIAANSDFRTMRDFGIRATNIFLYYKDLARATTFYTETLGMELVADYTEAKILRMSAESYLILVDVKIGMHTAEEPKTVAVALVTDQLDPWYRHLRDNGVPMRHEYTPSKDGPHEGFVAIDPEGYLLEFERFHPHRENEDLLPLLSQATSVTGPASEGRTAPEGLGFKATITWLYYQDVWKMQQFYEDVLGLALVADQGWAKIYRASNTGLIGLVDEKRGMHRYTKDKAVNVSFILEDIESWFAYAKQSADMSLRSSTLGVGDENKYKAFVGFDPEGYFLEFDAFYPHPLNKKLLDYLDRAKPAGVRN